MKMLSTNANGHNASLAHAATGTNLRPIARGRRIMRLSTVLGGLTLCLAPACSSATPTSPGTGTTVSGEAYGQPVPTTGTTALMWTYSGTTATGTAYTQTELSVVFTNIADACGVAQRHGVSPNATTLTLDVQVLGSSVPLGTYRFGAPAGVDTAGATAGFRETAADCSWKTNVVSEEGSITLTEVSATGEVAGTFDVTLPNGDHLTGSFDTTACEVNPVGDGGAPVCGS